MWLIHPTALLLQNLRCVIHRQLGELKDIAVFEMKSQISVRYCRGDGRSRMIHGSFCSRDSSPALTMAALIRLSTSLIRTSDNEKKKISTELFSFLLVHESSIFSRERG